MTLNEIENGILRSNRASAATLFLRPFRGNDKRLKFIVSEADARIHFALNCGAKSCPPLRPYTSENVQNELEVATKHYLGTDEGVVVDESNREVRLSKLMEWYKVDFGDTNKQVLQWVSNHLEEGSTKKQKLQYLWANGDPKISHLDYNWDHNGV